MAYKNNIIKLFDGAHLAPHLRGFSMDILAHLYDEIAPEDTCIIWAEDLADTEFGAEDNMRAEELSRFLESVFANGILFNDLKDHELEFIYRKEIVEV